MRAVGCWTYGGPDVLEVVELPDPEPAAGQVRIRVAASTVNPADSLLRQGGLAAHMPETERPFVAGLELAGVVDAAGPGATLAVGTRVAAMTKFIGTGRGGHAELAVVDERSAVPLPDGFDLVRAATLPMNGLTARMALDALGLDPGAWLGVTGAAGAVGALVVRLAVLEGLRVAAVAGPGDEGRVRELGAEIFVPRGEDAFTRLRELVPDGLDGLVDTAVVGEPVLPAVRDGGTVIALRGFAGELERGIDARLISVREYLSETAKLAELVRLAAEGELELPVAQTYPPEQAGEAHARVDGGGLRGRVVIVF